MIYTDRLIIREAQKSDSVFVAEIQTNEMIQKYMGGVIENYENTLNHIKSNLTVLNDFYIIILKSNKEKIGLITFPPNSEVNEKELSISLIPLYFHKGYGTEALNNITNFWLIKNKISYLYTTVSPDNKDSISMLERNNFKYIKEYKDIYSLQLLYKYEKNL